MKTIKIDEEKLKRFKVCERQLAEIEQAIFDAEEISREEEGDDFVSDIKEWIRTADATELEDLLNEIVNILGY